MAQRAIKVKVREGRQVVRRATVIMDPDRDRDALDVLGDSLRELGVRRPGPEHSIELYDGPRYLRTVSAA